jgi:hypothetical protein
MTASWSPAAGSPLGTTDAQAIRMFVQDLIASEPEAMDCQNLLEIVARYVDLDHLGGQPAEWMPGVVAHLGACDHCAELYDVLHALADQVEGPPPDVSAGWQGLRDLR